MWELSALEKHYYPAVSALAKACGKKDESSTLMYDMDDFLVHTYKSLFEEESKSSTNYTNKKRPKKAVPLTFLEPTSLFPSGDVLHGIIKI